MLCFPYRTPIKGHRSKTKPNPFAECIFFAVVAALTLNFAFQFGRGVSLAREKETDAAQTQGTVDEIEDMAFPVKYSLDGQAVWSNYIVIDGEKYYCMTGNCFKKGDSVEIEYLPISKFILKIEKIGGELGDLPKNPGGFRIDFNIVLIVIFAICIAILVILFLSSMLIRRKIGKRNYVGARKVALFYRRFWGGLKREKVSLTIALLYLLEGDRERAHENLSKIKDEQLDAAKKFWLVMDAYIYDDPALDSRISEFAFANKLKSRGVPSFDSYRSRLELVKRYHGSKNEFVLSELNAMLKDDDPLQTDLIMKAMDGEHCLLCEAVKSKAEMR